MTAIPQDFRGLATPLSATDLVDEATALNCGLPIIRAFSDIESGPAGGFIQGDGRPAMLYEARAFSRFTHGAFDRSHPNISSPVWDRTLYGKGGAHQYERLAEAITLDRESALLSCSIGRYQVMGFNFRRVGYGSVEDMWADYCNSERAHLVGFGKYVIGSGLLSDLQANPPRFVHLAIGYNGIGEASQGYDIKLQAAWRHYSQNAAAPPWPPAGLHARAINPILIGDLLAAQTISAGAHP